MRACKQFGVVPALIVILDGEATQMIEGCEIADIADVVTPHQG
jgi:hypothetical protein